MDRRVFVRQIAGAAATRALASVAPPLQHWLTRSAGRQTAGCGPPDLTLRIAQTRLEIAPGHVIKTLAYNGVVPGPMIRVAEGQRFTVEVQNDTDSPEWVHWHGLFAPDEVDGAREEGTPGVGPRESRQYTIEAHPAGTRYYHTHAAAGRDLERATYSGLFGFLYVAPHQEPAPYDDEVFLALHGWEGYLGTANGSGDTLDVIYKSYTVNAHRLGAGAPVQVREGRRVMLRILNANATQMHRLALPGHRFTVMALDGNPVAVPRDVAVLELGPAERVDAVVTMDQPGVWVLGEARDDMRRAGLGIVVEYAGRAGPPRWSAPAPETWDYTRFGQVPDPGSAADLPVVPLVFKKKFAGSRWVDHWTVNEKSFPDTDPIRLQLGTRYRLRLDNRSDEAHPVHLHRHRFELAAFAGVSTSGVRKDVVVVPPRTVVDADFTASGGGSSLLHCHNQLHMDYGFMTIVDCR